MASIGAIWWPCNGYVALRNPHQAADKQAETPVEELRRLTTQIARAKEELVFAQSHLSQAVRKAALQSAESLARNEGGGDNQQVVSLYGKAGGKGRFDGDAQLFAFVGQKLETIESSLREQSDLDRRRTIHSLLDLVSRLDKSQKSLAIKSLNIVNAIVGINSAVINGWRYVSRRLENLIAGNGVGHNQEVTQLAKEYAGQWKQYIDLPTRSNPTDKSNYGPGFSPG